MLNVGNHKRARMERGVEQVPGRIQVFGFVVAATSTGCLGTIEDAEREAEQASLALALGVEEDSTTLTLQDGVLQFAGGGLESEPLQPGQGPDTARQCIPEGDDSSPLEAQTSCHYDRRSDSEVPAALVEHLVETIDGVEMVHVRLTVNPDYVDNTFGDTAIGWENSRKHKRGRRKKPKHSFRDLLKSDKTKLELYDGDGERTMSFKLDYLTKDKWSPSGYGTKGVKFKYHGRRGRDAKGCKCHGRHRKHGRHRGRDRRNCEDYVLGFATSLDRNLNGCGYDYTDDSPATDADYTPSTEAPNWDYRVVYEIWINAEAFGDAGFGHVEVPKLHASPSKTGKKRIRLERRECPVIDVPDNQDGDDDCNVDTGECDDPDSPPDDDDCNVDTGECDDPEPPPQDDCNVDTGECDDDQPPPPQDDCNMDTGECDDLVSPARTECNGDAGDCEPTLII